MKLLVKILVAAVVFVVATAATLLLTEWRPEPEEWIIYEDQPRNIQLPDTLQLVSWNIGYGGLSAEMDFFYDGGTQTRTSESQTHKNLGAIISHLRTFERQGVDFVLLQEVDFCSKRSYYIDEYQLITQSLDYPYSATALNYSSPFVPIPLSDPMGGVESGLVVLSKYFIAKSVRRQYPSFEELPNRLFNLKRSMLSVAVGGSENDIVWINNTHNSAFDDGAMRRAEIQFINNIISKYPRSITAGDWNSTPPGYEASPEALENEFFSPVELTSADLPNSVEIRFDDTTPSVRYLDFPYQSKSNTTAVVDFAVSGKKCHILESKTLDLEFENSDHNPILITFVIEN